MIVHAEHLHLQHDDYNKMMSSVEQTVKINIDDCEIKTTVGIIQN